MKKDLSSLGIIPSIILGMLGYSLGISLLQVLSAILGQPLQADSMDALDHYRWIVAALFAITPGLALLISGLRMGWDEQMPLKAYFTYIPLMLVFALAGWVVEIYTMRLFQNQVDELMPGEQWVFAVSQLHPLRAGLAGIIFAWLLLFLITPFLKRQG